MLNNSDTRAVVARFVNPVASALLRIGMTPDMVTYIGTIATCSAALIFFPQGEFLTGIAVMVLFIFSDLLDGTMARLSGTQGPWGAWLDSTLDRVADGAVFGGMLIWAAWNHDHLTTAFALICVVGSFVISYAKARAESQGATANGGIAERGERLILGLVAAGLQSLGVPHALQIGLGILAVLVVITVIQRGINVKGQLKVAPEEAP